MKTCSYVISFKDAEGTIWCIDGGDTYEECEKIVEYTERIKGWKWLETIYYQSGLIKSYIPDPENDFAIIVKDLTM